MGGSTRALRGAPPSCQVARTATPPVASITYMRCSLTPRTTAREKSVQRLPDDEGEAMSMHDEDKECNYDKNRGHDHGQADNLGSNASTHIGKRYAIVVTRLQRALNCYQMPS